MRPSFLDRNDFIGNVFFPRKTRIPKSLPSNVEAIEVDLDEEIRLGGLMFWNDKRYPTMVMFHGNGEITMDYLPFASVYMSCGVNLLILDFRGYGFSSGVPTLGSLIDDALPAFEKSKAWLLDRDAVPSFFVFGRSLGSICAVEIGSHVPEHLKGVIIESGFARTFKLLERLLGHLPADMTPQVTEMWSNEARLKKFKKPTLVIHGTMDMIVPFEESMIIIDAIPDDVYKKLVKIEGAGHNDIGLYDSEYFSPLATFIRKFK
ncbi:MAG: alpha/beta hydrolase [Promethearchaeota archaeon]